MLSGRDLPGNPGRGIPGTRLQPVCIQEMSLRTRTVWIRSEWAFVFQTHCARHRTPLLERCVLCFTEDPLLLITDDSVALASCWNCGFSLLLYHPDRQASSMVAKIIDSESAILMVTAGYPPHPCWAGRSSGKAFIEKLRILVQHLKTPTEHPLPPFLGTRKNRGLDWIASASVSMEGCHRDSVSGEHSRPRSASPPSRPPVFPGLLVVALTELT
jgi:hypothetical protein